MFKLITAFILGLGTSALVAMANQPNVPETPNTAEVPCVTESGNKEKPNDAKVRR